MQKKLLVGLRKIEEEKTKLSTDQRVLNECARSEYDNIQLTDHQINALNKLSGQEYLCIKELILQQHDATKKKNERNAGRRKKEIHISRAEISERRTNGETVQKIADSCGISRSKFYSWMKEKE